MQILIWQRRSTHRCARTHRCAHTRARMVVARKRVDLHIARRSLFNLFFRPCEISGQFNFFPTALLLSSLDYPNKNLQSSEPVRCCWWNWCGSHRGSGLCPLQLLRAPSRPSTASPGAELVDSCAGWNPNGGRSVNKNVPNISGALPGCFSAGLLRN